MSEGCGSLQAVGRGRAGGRGVGSPASPVARAPPSVFGNLSFQCLAAAFPRVWCSAPEVFPTEAFSTAPLRVANGTLAGKPHQGTSSLSISAVCSLPPEPENGGYICHPRPCRDPLNSGSVIEYLCAEGYMLKGDYKYLTCKNGEWKPAMEISCRLNEGQFGRREWGTCCWAPASLPAPRTWHALAPEGPVLWRAVWLLWRPAASPPLGFTSRLDFWIADACPTAFQLSH